MVTYFILPRGWARRVVNRLLLVTGPIALLYIVIGWGRPEPAFAPLRAFATATSYSDSSTLAREEENRNLLYTLSTTSNPLTGTGWGMPYRKVTSVYANYGGDFWWQYEYLPHNSLLGVAVFGGLLGITGIWLVVPVAAFLAARGYRGATRPADGAASMAALAILPAYGVQCYGDIGFQSLTCSLLLGAAMAAAATVYARVAVRTDAAKGRSRRARHTPARLAAEAVMEPSTASTPPSGARGRRHVRHRGGGSRDRPTDGRSRPSACRPAARGRREDDRRAAASRPGRIRTVVVPRGTRWSSATGGWPSST